MVSLLKYKHLPCALLILSMFLTGCASKYGAQTTEVVYYAACYQPVAELRREEAEIEDSTTTGLVIGALLGALIGGAATGDAKGAAAGAVAGGAVGAVGGHAYATSDAKDRDEEFYRKYASQLDAETAQMSRANAAAKIAAQCYDREFKMVVANAQAGKISKIELTNRYEEIRSGLQETSRILDITYYDMHKKEAEYQKVMASETKVYDPVYAKTPAKSDTTAKKQVEVKKATTSTKTWQATKKELDTTKRDLDAQIENNDRILEAALQG